MHAKRFVAILFAAAFCAVAQAGMFSAFPKLMQQVPTELCGDYVLLTKFNPDKTQELFTNAPFFASISSNRIATTAGKVRPITGVMRITQNGTNVYAISFEDKTSWLATPNAPDHKLIIVEPKPENKKLATIYVVAPKKAAPEGTNAAPPARRN